MINGFSKADQADKALVLYHANCADGFGAAFAFWELNPYNDSKSVLYHPINYGEDIHHSIIEDDRAKYDLWIVDFSLPLDQLRILADVYNQVTVIDHHLTFINAIEEYQGTEFPHNLNLIWDTNRSGAMLTWDYLIQLFYSPSRQKPKLLEYIQDRDLWQFKLPGSKEVNAVIAATPKNFHDYNDLRRQIAYSEETVIASGKLLLAQHEKIVDDIVQASRSLEIYGTAGESYRGRLANCTGHFASDVGNKLAELSGTFGGTWCEGHDGTVKFSLRSIGDYNVEAIAKQYGGGGHKNAAGFSLGNPTPQIDGAIIWHKEPILPQGGM